jgi:sulfatase modifying factor 1
MQRQQRPLSVSLSVAILLISCGGGDVASQVVKAPEVGQPSPLALVPRTDPAQAGMALVTGGTFTMGLRKDTVTVQPFLLDVTEVTADAYAGCVRAGACTVEGLQCGPTGTYGVSGKGNHPINCVDWNQATAYCRRAGSRLPTEEEWEWAARGQRRGTKYPWGDDELGPQACWNRGNEGTCAVGSFPSGDAPGGIHDLAGNVWEWTASNYDATASARVLRGGSFDSPASQLLARSRIVLSPSGRTYFIGFRCSRTP